MRELAFLSPHTSTDKVRENEKEERKHGGFHAHIRGGRAWQAADDLHPQAAADNSRPRALAGRILHVGALVRVRARRLGAWVRHTGRCVVSAGAVGVESRHVRTRRLRVYARARRHAASVALVVARQLHVVVRRRRVT